MVKKNNRTVWIVFGIVVLLVLVFGIIPSMTGNAIWPPSTTLNSCEYIGYKDTGIQVQIGDICGKFFGKRYSPELVSQKKDNIPCLMILVVYMIIEFLNQNQAIF